MKNLKKILCNIKKYFLIILFFIFIININLNIKIYSLKYFKNLKNKDNIFLTYDEDVPDLKKK